MAQALRGGGGVDGGVDGLLDEPRPGAPRTIGDEDVERVIRITLEETPKDATHWSTRSMAQRTGMSQSAISRIWRAFALQPHRSETFKLSSDPLFIEKVRDIVGLYLHPPDRALVLCVDEKAQIQALDRSQPLLPMRPGQIERRTHDYVRNGTTSLFAALDTKTGEVIAECHKHHRSIEFRRFLDTIEATVPQGLDIHLIVDNYQTHKTQIIKRWLLKRPRFHLHTSPPPAHPGSTSSSAGSALSPKNSSDAASSVARASSRTRSCATSTSPITIPNPSSGPSPLIRSSKLLPAFVRGLPTQDTSVGQTPG